jgi:hypothetical protein
LYKRTAPLPNSKNRAVAFTSGKKSFIASAIGGELLAHPTGMNTVNHFVGRNRMFRKLVSTVDVEDDQETRSHCERKTGGIDD